jgi:phospholipase C
MWNGQILVAKILRSLIDYSHYNQWKWLLAITYDEHGGFYDHVVPPDSIEVKDANGNIIQTYPIPALQNDVRQLGPRVPSFLVSPFIPRGEGKVNVSHQVFEHASVAATILRRFCSPYPPAMPPRIQAAADFRSVLTLPNARPETDFVTLSRVCNDVANSAERTSGKHTPAWRRKLPRSAETELRNEDFGGLMAAMSSLTGRNVRA